MQALPIGDTWSTLPDPIAGQRYAAMRVATLDPTPFHLLADRLPGAVDAMGQYTLVVAGRPDGFILLAGRIGPDGRGHGEDHAGPRLRPGRRQPVGCDALWRCTRRALSSAPEGAIPQADCTLRSGRRAPVTATAAEPATLPPPRSDADGG